MSILHSSGYHVQCMLASGAMMLCVFNSGAMSRRCWAVLARSTLLGSTVCGHKLTVNDSMLTLLLQVLQVLPMLAVQRLTSKGFMACDRVAAATLCRQGPLSEHYGAPRIYDFHAFETMSMI